MSRLIDADALLDGIYSDNPKDVMLYIANFPTVEPRKGKWVNNLHDIPICNQCGYMTPYDRAIDDYEYGNYCPNCGARMSEGEENEKA